VDGHRCLTDRRCHASDIPFAIESPHHLDSKIDRHDGRAFMMIKKDVVALGPQTGVLAKKAPQCRVPV
jgi:hypothetical protein